MPEKITFEYLEKLYHKNEKRLRLGKKISEYEAWLTVAAGHTLDVIEVSNRSKDQRLDLTVETRDNLMYAMVMYGMSAKKAPDFNEDAWLTSMLKKAAAYELFVMYNTLSVEENVFCEIQLPEGGREVVLYAKNTESGAEGTINFYDAYRRMQEDHTVFALTESGEVLVYKGLASRIIVKEFLEPLGFVSTEEEK